MAFLIEITEGIQKGERFRVVNGATLGRKKADIAIKDPNVSSLHAKIEIAPNQPPIIVDQNSRNGLILNGIVVSKITLQNDTEFIIGDTPFKVFEVTDKELERLLPTKIWEERFSNYLNTHKPIFHKSEKLIPFIPKIELHFMQGLQFEETYLVGYGPRSAGLYSLDLAIHDEACPEQAFKLIPTTEGAKILNCSLDKVFLNDGIFESSILISGDKIKIGDTVIKVLFLNA